MGTEKDGIAYVLTSPVEEDLHSRPAFAYVLTTDVQAAPTGTTAPALWSTSPGSVLPGADFIVAGWGFGTAAVDYSAVFYGDTGTGPVVLTQVLWTHYTSIPEYVEVTLTMPSDAEGQILVWVETTVGISNSMAELVTQPTNPTQGWWIEVWTLPDNTVGSSYPRGRLITRIYDYLSFTFNTPLNDTGAWQVQISDWDDDIWGIQIGWAESYFQDFLSGGLQWYFIDQGARRFAGVYTGNLIRKIANEQGDRMVELSGLGMAECLKHAVVLPKPFVNGAKFAPRTFTKTSWSRVFNILFAEAIDRGAIPNPPVHVTFNANDSKGKPWTDRADYEITPGTSLYDLLNALCEKNGAEWYMDPFGRIYAAPAGQLGSNVGQTGLHVALDESADVKTADYQTDGTNLANWVYVESVTPVTVGSSVTVSTAVVSGNSSTTSRWGRREVWMSETQATTNALRDAAALNLRRALESPVPSNSVEVIFEPRARDDTLLLGRTFLHYNLADTVLFPLDLYGQPDIYGAVPVPLRILDIKIDVSPDVGTTVVLNVQNKRQAAIDKLNRLVARSLGKRII
jgi:hypothetical protein